MISFEPMVEIHLREYGEQDQHTIDLAVGVSFNRFRGDFDDDFFHASYPAYLQLGFRLNDTVFLKVSLGGQYWPKFDASDFAPLVVDVQTTRGSSHPQRSWVSTSSSSRSLAL